ncbi:hypothetical protein ACGFX4_16655 [Kitasatospora sp. NPDC048365]|uniref:hypothetical protein n=1 Tax=Kitasatospora sp. NPDC048365 TaxID=3364050 RepID=UPI0037241402
MSTNPSGRWRALRATVISGSILISSAISGCTQNPTQNASRPRPESSSPSFNQAFNAQIKKDDEILLKFPPSSPIEVISSAGDIWHFGWFTKDSYYCAGWVTEDAHQIGCAERGYRSGDGKTSIVYGAIFSAVGWGYAGYGYIRDGAVDVKLSGTTGVRILLAPETSADGQKGRFFVLLTSRESSINGGRLDVLDGNNVRTDEVALWEPGPKLGEPVKS